MLTLLFEQTKQLFGKWLYYGIGTMFSMAVLAVMTAISTKVILAVAEQFWAAALGGKILFGQNMTEGMTTQALQQGGIGLLLTVLLLTTPPMAAAFFQGTLGNFTPYVGFGASGGGSSSGARGAYPPGQGPVTQVGYQQVRGESERDGTLAPSRDTRTFGSVTPGVSSTNRGNTK